MASVTRGIDKGGAINSLSLPSVSPWADDTAALVVATVTTFHTKLPKCHCCFSFEDFLCCNFLLLLRFCSGNFVLAKTFYAPTTLLVNLPSRLFVND